MSDAEAPTVEFNPFSPEFRHDPYPSYRRMRDAGPVMRSLASTMNWPDARPERHI